MSEAGHETSVLSFTGPEDYLDLEVDLSFLREQVSIELWAKGDAAHDACTTVIEGGSAQNHRVLCVHLPYSGRIYWFAGNEGPSYDGNYKAVDLADYHGSWNHWAFVKDLSRSTLRVFRNGELWHECPSGRPLEPIRRLCIARGIITTSHWVGELAELRIWSIALSAEDIQQGMNRRCQGHEVGLVGYWPLCEGQGPIARDRTSYAHSGSVNGARWTTARVPLVRPLAAATGLEDYGYWLRWKCRLAAQKTDQAEGETYRRGRIWT